MESWLRGLYDAEGMRAVDRWAIEDQGVDSLELMENAGRAIAEAVARMVPEGPVRVVCGKGNNGGYGLVAEALLRERGCGAERMVLWPAGELTADAEANHKRLAETDSVRSSRRYPTKTANSPVVEVGGEDIVGRLAGSGAVVDAIFGTGFAGAPREPAAAAIAAINDCD